MSANDQMGQDEIDKLLNSSAQEITPADNGGADLEALLAQTEAAGADAGDGSMGQNDIDALLNGGGDMGQNDIDALLAQAAGNDAPAPASTAAPDDGAMNQDDISALFAQAGTAETAPAPDAPADDGAMSQDDINALLNNAAGEPAAAKPAAGGDDGPMSQDDISALLAASGEGETKDAAPESVSNDDIDALLAASGETKDAAPESVGNDDIDALLRSEAGDALAAEESAGDDSLNELMNGAEEAAAADADDAAAGNDNDLDAMLNAAGEMSGDIENMAEDAGEEASAEAGENPAPEPEIPQPEAEPLAAAAAAPKAAEPVRPLPAAPQIPDLPPEQLATLQDSLALSGSSGEVENLAGQISGLLGQLSEKSRRFQMAWLAAEQQARELRYQQTLAEHKMHVLASEKESVRQEADLLRKQQSQLEGEKIAAAEAHRTEIASLQLRIREQESRNQMLVSEGNALKEELERARNDATGADLESRRSRFDVERLNGELASERQERQRLARALENREKELQATQAQAAGHASTLFLDELHRLVRRLESELDIRGTAANEALSVFDRMEFTPEMQLHAATLRAALCTAAGLTPDESDALKNLDGQSARPNAIPPLNPAPAPGEDSFIKALTRYDFTRASGICSALMRAGSQTPYDCMKDMHTLEALRHPEISAHLDDLAALLRGIKSLQEASDRSRGRENEHTEKVFVMMFDLIHSLVRLKLVSRATPAIWELFLELRGRFSFLTSDRQFTEYRDRVLGGK